MMSVRPRLKPVPVFGAEAKVVVYRRALEQIHIDDGDGSVVAFLRLLSTGQHEVAALPGAMARLGFTVSADDIAAMVGELDRWGVLERADGDDTLDPATRNRHQSNLRYYDLFSSLDRTSADYQRAVANAHVLLLGAGGVGAGILQSLVGLGVGKVTLVDCDVVETKNLARQFAYGVAAVGQPKIMAAKRWVETYSGGAGDTGGAGGTEVVPVHRRVANAADIRSLAAGADVVICAIDSPEDIFLLVNEACCELRIPFVSGGLSRSTLTYWSVAPGVSPCRLCLELHQRDRLQTAEPALRGEAILPVPKVNRATGPVAQLSSALLAMEAMRYVTRTEPPVAAAVCHVVELADGMSTARDRWDYHPDCHFCSSPDGAQRGRP